MILRKYTLQEELLTYQHLLPSGVEHNDYGMARRVEDMKRVLHISKYYYPFRGGTEQIAQDCLNSLMGKYEQKVICFNDKNEDQTDKIDGIEVIRCAVFKTIASQGLSRSFGKQFKTVIEDFKPDIFIFHYPNPFVAYYILKYIPKTCKLAIYWHMDIVKQKFLKQFFTGQNKKLVERADVLIATSPTYVDGSPWLSSAKDKCRVVPNCINVERLVSSPEVEAKATEIRKQNEGKMISDPGQEATILAKIPT